MSRSSESRSSGGGKASLPWSVKGVTHTARDLAKEQAQDTGATMGQWLSGVVRRVGASEASGKALVPSPSPEAAHDQDDPSVAADNATAEAIDERELVDMVSERILATEERLVGLLGNLEDIIVSLGDRLERLERRIESDPGASDQTPNQTPHQITSGQDDDWSTSS